MEDVLSFHTRAYKKSDDLKEITMWSRTITLVQALPILVTKLFIVIIALIFEWFNQIFDCFVPKPLNDIRGQLAVVTGGSNGIGRETCLELARCGCNIACLDLDFDAAKQLCKEIRRLGVKANAYKVDVSDSKQVQEVKKEINADLGIVDILVNNAGLMPKTSLREDDTDTIRRVMDVNILSHFWTTRTFIGDMIERHSGYVVGISSMLALYPMSTTILYTASKCAVKGFMEALTRESLHENWGVKTLTVFPHFTNTRKEMIDYARQTMGSSTVERMGIREPIEVAIEIVRSLRSDDGCITIPRYYSLGAKIYQSFPFKIQHFFDKLVMPRMTSSSEQNITKEHQSNKQN